MTAAYYGKYRGSVVANEDPSGLGRVRVSCPEVLGDGESSWATPVVPYAGKGVGLFLIPPVGASGWVEFEGGDPGLPIWAGCYWADGEVPADPAAPATKMLKTDGLTLTMDDTSGSGGLSIKVASPAVSTEMTVKLTSSGIELAIGSSKVLLSTTSVSVNDGALEVM
jgi:uncharacterized protein involved in type VI secretion and phage assembly